jgi:2-keto-3-deoxy-L-rhamnonate aldolase RhmA
MKLGPGHSTHLMGTIVSIPHTISARTLAVLGYDFVMIDAQHTYVHPLLLGTRSGIQV